MSRRNKAQARSRRVNKALSPTTMQFVGAQPTGLAPREFALMDAINVATARLSASGLAGTFEPLPRDPLDTTAFGPLNPLAPDPIDLVRRDTGRVEPRVFEYQNGWNLPGAGSRETPWQVLRAAADGVSIIRSCLEVRKRHIRSLKWEIAPAKEAVQAAYQADQTRSQDSIEADMRADLLPEINRLREFWKKPWHANDWRLGQWANAVVEELLVLDGAAIYPRMNYGGQVLDLEVLDAATIKLLLDWRGARPQPPYAAFQQILYGFPRGEWTASATRDEQGNEIVENGFAAGELFYYRENVRSFTPYGYPPVERALMDSRLWLKRFGWLLAEYDDGSTPLTFLETAQAPDGTRLDVTQRRLYEEAINDELMGQTGRRHRMKVLPADWKPHQMATADERYQPNYDLFIIKLVAAHFGVPIAELGFTDAGGGLGSAGWHEGQAEVSGRVGLRPDVEVLSDLINAVQREFLRGPAELEFRFIDPVSQNDKDSDSVADLQVRSGRITLNDDRRRLGLALYDFVEADMPMIQTATGPVFLEGSFQRAQEAAEAAKQQQLAGAESARGKLELEGAKLEDGQKAREETLELERERMDRAEASDAQKMAELGAFRTWRRRNPEPKRPFVFKAITPDDGFPDLEGLTPDVVDFGPDWDFFVDDLEKGVMTWLEWNAKNPMRPRGPDGRWVKRGGGGDLPDALRREGERTSRLSADGGPSTIGGMEKRPIKRNDMVEWTPGGLARVDSDPFKKYGKEHVKIFPFKTGASSDEGRYTREWPVDQLALADMKQWEYDAKRNAYRQRSDEPAKPRRKTSAEKDAEHRALKARQERARAAADLAMDVDELIGIGASDAAIRERLGEGTRFSGLQGEALRNAVWADAEAAGMERIGGRGDELVSGDPAMHRLLDGSMPEAGQTLRVLRPGARLKTGEPYAMARTVPEETPELNSAPAPTARAKLPKREGKARRGDVLVVEQRHPDFKGRVEYPVFEITAVTRAGEPRMLRDMAWDTAPRPIGRFLGLDLSRSQILPGDQVNIQSLGEALGAHTYPKSDTPRTYEDLRELRDALLPHITFKAAVPDDFAAGAPDLEGDADPKADAPVPPDQRWPGWAVDTAIAAAVAPMLMAAVAAGVRVGALVTLLKDWLGSLGLHAGDPVPDARAVRSWLVTGTDIKDQLFEELIPPIRQAHIEGWMVGQHSADALMDWVQEHQESPRNAVELSLNWGEWEPGHPEAARLLIEPGGLGRLLAQSNVQIKSIVDHRLDEIGRIIGQGLQRGDSPDTIAKALTKLVNDPVWAKKTAVTETNRAMSAASVESYRRGGCWGKGWMTAYDQRVCPICKLNEEMPDGSPRVVPIDEPFPSGDPWPPGHPWCRCAITPVFELTRGF